MAKIIAFSGSSRAGSYNQMLANFAAKEAMENGAEVTVVDLAEFPLPLFNEDLEKEQPRPGRLAELHQMFLEHEGLLISSPEYNSSISPLLKNTIDWLSRSTGDHAGLAAFSGKVAGLMSASPGGLGGIRGLVHVRSILQNIGVIVVPEQLAVSRAHEAFDDNGSLKDQGQRETVNRIATKVNKIAGNLA